MRHSESPEGHPTSLTRGKKVGALLMCKHATCRRIYTCEVEEKSQTRNMARGSTNAVLDALTLVFTRAQFKIDDDAQRFVCTGLSVCKTVRLGIQATMPARKLSLYLSPYGNYLDALAWLGRYPHMVGRVEVEVPTSQYASPIPRVVSYGLKVIGSMLRHHPKIRVVLLSSERGFVVKGPLVEFCEGLRSPFVWPRDCAFRLDDMDDAPDWILAHVTDLHVDDSDRVPDPLRTNADLRRGLLRIHRVCSAEPSSSEFAEMLSTFPSLETASIRYISGDVFGGMASGYANLRRLGIDSSSAWMRLSSIPSNLQRTLESFGVVQGYVHLSPEFWADLAECSSLRALMLPCFDARASDGRYHRGAQFAMIRLRALRELSVVVDDEEDAVTLVMILTSMPWLESVDVCFESDIEWVGKIAAAHPVLRDKLRVIQRDEYVSRFCAVFGRSW